MRRSTIVVITLAAAIGLSACGKSAKSLLSTGSLFGNKQPEAVGAAAQSEAVDPSGRAIQVGWVSARARKCGFYFDPAKLKEQYIAAEAATGMPLAQLRKLELTYQYSMKSTLLKIAKDDAYCTDPRTASIRKDLQRHLTGDFTPAPRKKPPPPAPTIWNGGGTIVEKMDREKIFNPRR